MQDDVSPVRGWVRNCEIDSILSSESPFTYHLIQIGSDGNEFNCTDKVLTEIREHFHVNSLGTLAINSGKVYWVYGVEPWISW